MDGHLPVDLTLNHEPVAAHTAWWSAGGGAVLTLATSLKAGGEAMELISTYVSHPSLPTLVHHLTVLGALDGQSQSKEQPYIEMNSLDRRRDCAYEHLQTLLEELRGLDLHAQVLVNESSFAELEGAVGA